MASLLFLLAEHCWVFTLFVFFLTAAVADTNLSSFSFPRFDKDSKLGSSFAFFGDAKVADGGNAVQLTDLGSSNVGQVVFKKPINLVEGESRKLMYFSTNFSFSVFPDNGNGLAFSIAPSALNPLVSGNGSEKQKFKVIAVHFKSFRDSSDGSLLHNQVGIYVGNDGMYGTTNGSSSLRDWVSNDVEKSQAWIDYVVGTRRLEVRLGKNGDLRPSKPLLSHPINFMQLVGEEVFVGLSSSNGNSSQKCSIYSWSFELKRVPKWLHSRPADPKTFAKNTNQPSLKQKKDCFIRVLAAMIFGTGTGALTAFVVLFLWTIFGRRRQVMPEEYKVGAVDSKYKKIEVLVLEKSIEDGRKVDV